MTDVSFKCCVSLLLIIACLSSLIVYFANNIYWVQEQCGDTDESIIDIHVCSMKL
jgi:hypothetical protein